MNKINILITLVGALALSGCLERERLEERDRGRTDSALVVIEKLMYDEDSSSRVEIENLKREIEIKNSQERKITFLQKIKKSPKNPDTLLVERTLTYVYSKKKSGDTEEMVLDSLSIIIDTCYHQGK